MFAPVIKARAVAVEKERDQFGDILRLSDAAVFSPPPRSLEVGPRQNRPRQRAIRDREGGAQKHTRCHGLREMSAFRFGLRHGCVIGLDDVQVGR